MKILILGCGNMARALCEGMYAKNPSLEFITYTPSKTRAQALANDLGGRYIDSLDSLPESDLIMIACKPQQFDKLAAQIMGKIGPRSLVLSIMAGINVKKIQTNLGVGNVLRVMPNTPNMVGEGVNALYFSSAIDKQIVELFKSFSTSFIFEDENEIDTITPFSGSGAAYFFEMTALLTHKLTSLGISPKVSREMVEQTFIGAAKLLEKSEKNAETLRDEVTSFGGVTAKALETFREHKMDEMVDQAIDLALIRNKELS